MNLLKTRFMSCQICFLTSLFILVEESEEWSERFIIVTIVRASLLTGPHTKSGYRFTWELSIIVHNHNGRVDQAFIYKHIEHAGAPPYTTKPMGRTQKILKQCKKCDEKFAHVRSNLFILCSTSRCCRFCPHKIRLFYPSFWTRRARKIFSWI